MNLWDLGEGKHSLLKGFKPELEDGYRIRIDAVCQRIYRNRPFGGGDLDQAEYRPVGLFSNEFGIDSDKLGV